MSEYCYALRTTPRATQATRNYAFDLHSDTLAAEAATSAARHCEQRPTLDTGFDELTAPDLELGKGVSPRIHHTPCCDSLCRATAGVSAGHDNVRTIRRSRAQRNKACVVFHNRSTFQVVQLQAVPCAPVPASSEHFGAVLERMLSATAFAVMQLHTLQEQADSNYGIQASRQKTDNSKI